MGMRRNMVCAVGAAAVLVASECAAQNGSRLAEEIGAIYPKIDSLYSELHRHPELSGHEVRTAARLAAGLRSLGFEVAEGVGGAGIVGVLRNGPGPAVMLRTEMDALPIRENTGLPCASVESAKEESGAEVGVMHACGHDLHMSAWMGTAAIMATGRANWSGTLLLIGQPAEETGGGAKAMLADGLFERFPRPTCALAIHDDARMPAGLVGIHAGPIMSNSDNVDITIFGRGGHGARPEATVDPIVIAARLILSLQTVVSRENSPFDPAVITVGSIHGGARNNVIPDEVRLKLTVRCFTQPVRRRLLSAIDRIAKAEALAAAAPREPLIEQTETAHALVNDSAITARVAAALIRGMDSGTVTDGAPEMTSEDLTEYQIAGVPTLMLRIGAVEKARYDESIRTGSPLPALHSSQFAPDREPAIKTSIAAEVLALRALLPNGGSAPR